VQNGVWRPHRQKRLSLSASCRGGLVIYRPAKSRSTRGNNGSVAANFLQDNNIKFQIGEATQTMKTADLADQAKALSAFIECQ
jgi:hypothetical protein